MLFEGHTKLSEHFFELLRRLTKFAEDFRESSEDAATGVKINTKKLISKHEVIGIITIVVIKRNP